MRYRPPMTDEELAQAKYLLEVDGCSYSEVARTLERNIDTIRKHFPGRGWRADEAGRWGNVKRWAQTITGVRS